MAVILTLYDRQSKSGRCGIVLLKYIIAIAVLVVMLMPMPVNAQQSFAEKMRKQIDKTIAFETDIDYEMTPGFIVGIIDGKSSIVLSFGKKDILSEDTISIDDVFELGSVTKVFTASLIAEMDKLGLLSVGDRIDSLLPQSYRNTKMAQMTIKDLLIHQSGLPRYPPFEGDLENPLNALSGYTLENLLALYRNFTPQRNDHLIYSNVGYALIEPLLYGATGIRYDVLLQKYLLGKIGLLSTNLGPTIDIAPGYDLAVEPVAGVEFSVFNPSGGLRSNMVDLLRFVRYSLYESPDILWQNHGIGLGKFLSMGLGWHIVHQGKFALIYIHTGRSVGHTAFVGLVPDTQTGVVILANSANGVDDLGLEILRMINKNWKRKH